MIATGSSYRREAAVYEKALVPICSVCRSCGALFVLEALYPEETRNTEREALTLRELQQMGLRGATMQADNAGVSRREFFQAAAAGVTVLAASTPAMAQPRAGAPPPTSKKIIRMKNEDFAPVITIFDHRGCAEHENKEYRGQKSGDQDDEMLVKVKQTKLKRDLPRFADMADSVLQQSLSTLKSGK